MATQRPGLVIAAIAIILCGIWLLSGHPRAEPEPAPTILHSSDESFGHTALYFGCRSQLTADAQKALFDKEYRNHWMTWSGLIVEAEGGTLTIREELGWWPQQAEIALVDPHAGEKLIKGDSVTVRFVLTEPASVSCRFEGTRGEIMPDQESQD